MQSRLEVRLNANVTEKLHNGMKTQRKTNATKHKHITECKHNKTQRNGMQTQRKTNSTKHKRNGMQTQRNANATKCKRNEHKRYGMTTQRNAKEHQDTLLAWTATVRQVLLAQP